MIKIRKKNFTTKEQAKGTFVNYLIANPNVKISFESWLKQNGHTYTSAAQAVQAQNALDKLKGFLNANEPELVYFLQNTMGAQGKAITYKELREALMTGVIDKNIYNQWTQDYSKFVVDHLKPSWVDAMSAANTDLAKKYPTFVFNGAAEGVQKWTATRAADFVTSVTQTQIEGLRAVVQRAAVLEDMTVDQLSRAIRPMVGLTYQQGIANLNYYESMVQSGLSNTEALERSAKYSARQQRYRGYNIARTELAFAYNQGSLEGVQQAQAEGLMGHTKKVWCTADDERVCSICGGLEGKSIEMDEDFEFKTKLSADPQNATIKRMPPAHPSCLFPGNKVSAADVLGGSIRRFEGIAVTLRTSSGNQMTCTPNHPILTDRGWIGAGELNEGDKVIETTSIDGIMRALKANDYNMPTAIEKIADSFLMSSGMMTRSMPISAEDFHGDGIDGDVGVIYTNSLLRNDGKTMGTERINEGELGSGDVTGRKSSLISKSGDITFVDGRMSPGRGDICSNDKLLSFVGTKAGHSNDISLASVTDSNAIISKHAGKCSSCNSILYTDSKNGIPGDIIGDSSVPNSSMTTSETVFSMSGRFEDTTIEKTVIKGSFRDAELIRDLLNSKSGLVQATSIVKIEKKFVTDHVYNLHTNSGIYFCENITTHNCRCTVLFEEVAPPVYQPEQTAQNEPQTQTQDQTLNQTDDEPQEVTIPEDFEVDPKELTNQGNAGMGGTGESYIYEDQNGQKYLYKPAQSKGGTPEPFRAYVQQSGYKVQGIVDGSSAVPVGVSDEFSEGLGSIQKIMPNDDAVIQKLRDFQSGTGTLEPEIIEQLQREHTTDWLLANYDGHARNFIYDSATGTLRGVDKEQSFKYLQQPQAQKMSYKFHPNAKYGEKQPIYNDLFRKYADNEIDLDLNNVLPYIKRVESVSSKEYREVFREYAEALNGKGKAAEALLDDIVARKEGLRDSYRNFYEELIEQRTGIKKAFVFADEATQAATQTISARTMTKEAASKLTSSELKKIGKTQSIPNFGNMTKSELIECLTDPSMIPINSEKARLRIAAQAARRKTTAPKAVANTMDDVADAAPAAKGTYNAKRIFDDLEQIPEDKPLGVPINSDSKHVEGLNMTARRVRIIGQDYYEITGKLTESSWREVQKTMQAAGAKSDKYLINAATRGSDGIFELDTLNIQGRIGTSAKALTYTKDGITIDLVNDFNHRGLMGEVRIRVPAYGTGSSDALKLQQALKDTGLDFIGKTPTIYDETLMKKAQLLYRVDPKASFSFGYSGKKEEQIDDLLHAAGLSDKDIKTAIDKMEKQTVYNGYASYTFPEAETINELKKRGYEYAWSGIEEDGLLASIKNGGMASSRIRTTRMGIENAGKSVSADMESGGSDNVFTRIATKGSKKYGEVYTSSYAHGNFQVIYKPGVVSRADIYAYEGDNFGTTKKTTMESRPTLKDFVEAMNQNYRSGNEIMFRNGIAVEDWMGIDTGSKYKKDQLIQRLKSEGITNINGITLDKFIRVNTIVGTPWK